MELAPCAMPAALQPFRLPSAQNSTCAAAIAMQVGVMVATCQLDVSLLVHSFDLSPFDAFMPREVYEECETTARYAAADKVRTRALRAC